MTTSTNSEGLEITHTNELLYAILIQLNASNNYYATGEHNIIFIKIGSNKFLVLGCTYFININVFQNCTINGNLINNYDL